MLPPPPLQISLHSANTNTFPDTFPRYAYEAVIERWFCVTIPPVEEELDKDGSFPLASSFPWCTDVDLFSVMLSPAELLAEKNCKPYSASSHALWWKQEQTNASYTRLALSNRDKVRTVGNGPGFCPSIYGWKNCLAHKHNTRQRLHLRSKISLLSTPPRAFFCSEFLLFYTPRPPSVLREGRGDPGHGRDWFQLRLNPDLLNRNP